MIGGIDDNRVVGESKFAQTIHEPAHLMIDLPENRTRDFESRPWWHEAVLTAEPTGDPDLANIRKNYSRIPEQSDEQLREIIANTYGQIALIDHQVGRLMNCLGELGLADNTIVVYASDHGDWLGDHGLVLKGPMHYEGLLRVPLIIRGPGISAGEINDSPVSTMDLATTFADYGKAEPLLKQNGSSLRPLLETDADRECARNEWDLLPTRAGVQLSLRTVRTKTAKMTKDLISGAGEMYDLATDPHEMTNLFDDPAHAALRAELEALIDRRPDDMLPLQTQVGMA